MRTIQIAILTMLTVALFGFPQSVMAQDPPNPPVLHPVEGSYECSVTQTVDGDVFNMSCVESDSPLADEWDYELFDIQRYEPSISDAHWLEFNLRANTEILQVVLEYVFYPPGDPYGVVEDSVFDRDLRNLRPGQRVSVTVIPDVLGPDLQWDRVSISAADGFRCKGCGTYAVESLPETDSIDMGSIDPADINIVLDEITSRTLGR